MTDDDDILNGEKWVRIMCDYAARGVWDKKGRACHFDDLPVSDDIRTMIAEWQAWYEHSEPEVSTTSFDAVAHAAFGLFIARLVKRALPDWTVIYFDEAASTGDWRSGMPRDAFEYEIVLKPDGAFSP